jgi:hypothetical protein
MKTLPTLMVILLGHCGFSQNIQVGVASVKAEFSVPSEQFSAGYLNNISTKAVRNFKNAFKNVRDEKWYEMPDGFRANFTLGSIRHRLDYDKKGNWLHTIRYYDEKNLPTDVRRLVVSTYLDHKITCVEEVETSLNNLFYVIHLEGQANWINIKVSALEIVELGKITKS